VKKVFVYADYSQVELRIAAHLSQDPKMLEAFQLDLDPHKITAASMFKVAESDVTKEQRQAGKTTNFLLIFDGGPGRLQEQLSSVGLSYTMQECKEFRNAYFAAYPRYREHLGEILETVSRMGALVSECGRLRRLPEIVYGRWLTWDRRLNRRVFNGPPELAAKLHNFPGEKVSEYELSERAGKKFSHAKKQAYNFPVQSLGASITKRAIIALQAQGFTVRSTVHDSIIVEALASEAAQAAAAVKATMEGAYLLSVPLKVDVKILNSLDESDTFSIDQCTTLKIV
jgi:DNA polymerase-1